MDSHELETRMRKAQTRVSRRDVLRTAALGSLATCLPAWAVDADDVRSGALPPAALGYWFGGAALESFAAVRPGWTPRCASRGQPCLARVDDRLVAADGRGGTVGRYRARVLGMANPERAPDLRIRALHADGAAHDVWSSWTTGAGVAVSSPVRLRWSADEGEGLVLALSRGARQAASVRLPACPGVYSLLVTQPAPYRWRRLALRSRDPQRRLALQLVSRASGAPITDPYVLLVVDRLA